MTLQSYIFVSDVTFYCIVLTILFCSTYKYVECSGFAVTTMQI